MNTTQIWTAFSQNLHQFLRRRVACPADADDLLQDVFLKIHLKLPSLSSAESLPFWVWRLTRNTLLDYWKRRRLPLATLEKAENQVADLPDENLHFDFEACIHPFLELLSAERREAIELADFQQISQKELAERWKISHSGAKSRVQRARLDLEKRFRQCCDIQTDSCGNILDYQPRADAPPEIMEARKKVRQQLKKEALACVFPCVARL